MPELGQFSKKLPENIGFITICDNSKVNDKVVEKIFDKSKFHPTTLVDGDENSRQYLITSYMHRQFY